ncbi:hypothetical protein GCM10010522_47600 [Kribbella solani]
MGHRRHVSIITDARLARDILADGGSFQKTGNIERLRYAIGDGTASCRFPKVAAHGNLDAWRNQKRAALHPAFVQAPQRVGRMIQEDADTVVTGWLETGAADLEDLIGPVVRSFACMYEPRSADSLLRLARTVVRTRAQLEQAVSSRVRLGFDRDFSWSTRVVQLLLSVDSCGRAVRARRQAMAVGMAESIGSSSPAGESSLLSELVTLAGHVTGTKPRPALLGSAANLFLAGWENTLTAAIWTLYLLAGHGEVQEWLASAPDETSRQRRLNATIKEGLRLYPPVWSIPREVAHERRIGDEVFKPGELLLLSPWIYHHRPADWRAPEKFEPARFMTHESRAFYIPFGVGPRRCQGQATAVRQLTTLVDRICARAHLELVNGSLQPHFGMVQYPIGQVHISVLDRTKPRVTGDSW